LGVKGSPLAHLGRGVGGEGELNERHKTSMVNLKIPHPRPFSLREKGVERAWGEGKPSSPSGLALHSPIGSYQNRNQDRSEDQVRPGGG